MCRIMKGSECVHVYVIVVVQVGLTSLILATQSGHTEAVKALLEANADPNITEKVSLSFV